VGAVLAAAALGVVLWQGCRMRRPLGDATRELVVLDEAGDTAAGLTGCFLDADQAAFYLMQAGTYIRFSVENCKDLSTVSGRCSCASSVSTVIASLGWTTSYIAASVNSCGKDVNLGASCAAYLATFVAELGEFSFVASAVVDSCDINGEATKSGPGNQVQLRPGEPMSLSGEQPGQHLASAKTFFDKLKLEQSLQKENEETGQDTGLKGATATQCLVDLNVGLTYLGRVGVQIYFLAQECPKNTPDMQKRCSLDIFNVISSIGWAAQFLANAAIDCPDVPNARASCTGVITDLIATVAALGPVVNGISDDCHKTVAGGGAGGADFFG